MENIASYIDHTLLKANATKEDIIHLCEQAKKYKFKAVCVNPIWVSFCAKILIDEPIEICTVIGFPLGANETEVKLLEAKKAVENGATEIDIVLNIGKLKSNNEQYVLDELIQIVNSIKNKSIVKVIIETALLTEKEKKKACQIVLKSGADFVKTSTGFAKQGATIEDITLMKSIVGNDLFIKASGGIKNLNDAKKMLQFGASRIGTSSGVEIVKESYR